MKRTLTFISLLISILSFATEQIPDILIWENDTISLHNDPLASYPKLEELNLFGNKRVGNNTACWKGYISEWKIIKNTLYLSNIYSCDYFYSDLKIKAELKKIFPKEYKNGMVLANWYSDELSVPDGKLINKKLKIYESEYVLSLKKGMVIDKKKFDNSESYTSTYTQDSKKLNHFILKNINWNNIPHLKEGVHKVFGIIKSGSSKTDFTVKIKSKSEYPELEKEALRILKLLPEFDFHIKAGKVINVQYFIPIIFNKKYRPK